MACRAKVSYSLEMNELLARITIRPQQCHGHPCIRGMRIRVVDVLEMLAGGIAAEEILADFPDLEPDDIRAVQAYAANLTDEFVDRNRDALNASIRLGRKQLAEGDIPTCTIDDIIAEGRERYGKG